MAESAPQRLKPQSDKELDRSAGSAAPPKISTSLRLVRRQRSSRLLLRDVDHVVVGVAVDEFVVGVDAGERRLLVDDDLESLVFLGELFLLQIQGFLFVFLSTE